MFDIGIGEVFVILVVALLVFGPERLPEMARQAASFVRDLRAMVANARRDLSGSIGDLGLDADDVKTLSELRNPRSFVRKRVLDGVDLNLDDFSLDDDEPSARRRSANGASAAAKRRANGGPTGLSKPASTSATPAEPATTDSSEPAAAATEPPRFDTDAT